MLCFCFFKQKTAYEMRISDWSSDVCSSDLPRALVRPHRGQRVEHIRDGNDPGLDRNLVAGQTVGIAAAVVALLVAQRDRGAELDEAVLAAAEQFVAGLRMAAHQPDRKSVV